MILRRAARFGGHGDEILSMIIYNTTIGAKNTMSRKGFTLIELLVVIAIISIR